MENFPYKWRFDDSNYKLLPEEDLAFIIPITTQEAGRVWEDIFGHNIPHLMKITNNSHWPWMATETVMVDTDIYNTANEVLNSININADSNIIFLWSKTNAVKVKWGIFIKYWNDFCYPSDDNDVLYINNNLLISFNEEVFTVYKRI